MDLLQQQKEFFYRGMDLDFRKVNEKDRSVDVSFSSEQAIRRWFGVEILKHGPGNVDLSRLRSMGAALLNHNPSVIVGPLRNVRVEDKRGKSTIVFDDDEDGNKAFAKVRSGSLKGVSVGYLINKARRVEEDEEYEGIEGPALIALKWTPYEISLTPIPADASIGVGRQQRRLDDVEIISRTFTTEKEGNVMNFLSQNRVLCPSEKQAEVSNLLRIAEAIGGIELKCRVADCIGADDMERAFEEIASASVDGQGATTSIQGGQGQRRTPHINEIDDDILFRSICNPSLINFDTDMASLRNMEGEHTPLPDNLTQRVTHINQVSDDWLFESIKKPRLLGY